MSIFEQLGAEWHDDRQRAEDWFRRHGHDAPATTEPGDTIAADDHDTPAQGALMSLAAIAADVRTAAENGVREISKLLDEHLPQVEALGQLIDGNPVFASAEGAAHVPLELLQGVATLLDTMAAAHPKPEAAETAAEAAPEPVTAG